MPMRTLTRTCLVAATVLSLSLPAAADEASHRRASEDLLKAMNVDVQLKAAIDQMVDLQVKSNPRLAGHGETLKRFFAKHMSWESLKDEMIEIYAGAFTEEELKQITAFYRTPAGKKVIAKMPELLGKGMQLGVKHVQDNQSELIRMLQEQNEKADGQKTADGADSK